MAKACEKWLVCWDFPARPKTTFYDVLAAEFPPPIVQFVQRSVVLVRDAVTARYLRALCQWYGGRVDAFLVDEQGLDELQENHSAEEWISQLLERRLARRGRLRTRKSRHHPR